MDLTAAELKIFRDVFSILDTSEDGRITEKEIEQLSESLELNLQHYEIASLMHMTDRKGVGYISFGCFLKTMIHTMSTKHNDDVYRNAFRVFDTANCGFITTDSLRNLLIQLNQRVEMEDIESMIRTYDTDKDGFLSYEDFVSMMTEN